MVDGIVIRWRSNREGTKTNGSMSEEHVADSDKHIKSENIRRV